MNANPNVITTCHELSPATLVDDVVPTIDVKRLARNEAGGVMREEGGGDAQVVDADETSRWRLCLRTPFLSSSPTSPATESVSLGRHSGAPGG
jgi:hypothetical protein